MPKAKAPFNLEATLAGLDDSYIECRELTHSWAAYDVIAHTSKLWEEVVQCSRCETEKSRYVNPRTGAVIRPWRPRMWAPGYLFKGAGPVTAERGDAVRKEALRRKAKSRRTPTTDEKSKARARAA